MKVLVWGTGKVSKDNYLLYKKLNQWMKDEIIGFLDNDLSKREKTFQNLPIYSPAELENINYDGITVWVKDGKDDIIKQLNEMGVFPKYQTDIFVGYKNALFYNHRNEMDNPELKQSLETIRSQMTLDVYHFDSYDKEKHYHEVIMDDSVGLYYVMFDGKRLYLKRNWNDFIYRDGKLYLKYLYGEQDFNSPHLYEEGDVYVEEGDVLIDAGACEGNFSLHNIDKISKVYLIECDPDWMEALRYTFKPYEDKVVFINKFLSNHDDGNNIRMDTFVDGKVDFIKMDIEGEEINALRGARRILATNKNIKCSICAYHRHDDEIKIKGILSEFDIKTSVSRGYMLFYGDQSVVEVPELRKGIVRGIKKKENERMELQYLNMMNQWLILKQNHMSFERFFLDRQIHTIGIYGMGIYGRHLVRELKESKRCKVIIGLDRKQLSPYLGVEVIHPDQKFEIPDAIVDTVICDKKHKNELKMKYGVKIFDLEELIFDIAYEKKNEFM